jgi:excisionase family DNA binding protein
MVITSTNRELLTAAVAAQRLGVSVSTIRRWASSGALPAVRLGAGELARIRVPADALDRFVRDAHAEGDRS